MVVEIRSALGSCLAHRVHQVHGTRRTHRSPGVHRTTGARAASLAVITAAMVGLCTTNASALGAFEHPCVEESITGLRGILLDTFALNRDESTGMSVFAEISEVELYGVSGLQMPGVRVGFRRGSVSLVGEAAQLSSDIGSETRMSLTTAIYAGDRWASSVGLVNESAAIDDLASARLVSLTARSRIRLSKAIFVGSEIAGLRLAGESYDGVDAAVVLSVRPASNAAVYASLEFDRWSGMHPSVSTVLAGYNTFRVLFGYEGVTDVVKGALAIDRAGFVVAVGATYHPVLGTRQGITVSWRR
ncbi:MAG: hypothetical protein KAJ17_03740 [Candidatus Krumholzibacteria bacterium]|nr:hypothetical protein [Candidatus Krumholzibacteria bacterium]